MSKRRAPSRGLRRVVIRRIGGHDPERPELSRDPTLEPGAPSPGPWRLSEGPGDGSWDDPRRCVESADGKLVCVTVGGNDVANATLIAAAPEMLQALEAYEDALSLCGAGTGFEAEIAAAHERFDVLRRVAIRKARGLR